MTHRLNSPPRPSELIGALVALGTLGALLVAGGCGPSIQSIHEGSVRFEHCYRLDLDPKIALSHRHACWEQWLEVYSFGQSRDRLEHARRRVEELTAGDPNPPRLNLESHRKREARQFYMSTPGPVNVHAPPPPVAAPAVDAEPPGDTCVQACQRERAACEKRCPPAETSKAAADDPADPVERKTAPTKPDTSDKSPAADEANAEESNDSKCSCERDYKTCGLRCFDE